MNVGLRPLLSIAGGKTNTDPTCARYVLVLYVPTTNRSRMGLWD
jgi:hypothetical protein